MIPICFVPSLRAFFDIPLYSNATVLMARISSSHPVNDSTFFFNRISEVTNGAEPTRLIVRKFVFETVLNVITVPHFL